MTLERNETTSLCPFCLSRISAHRAIQDKKVYLVKKCPAHGEFKVLIWSDADDYNAWAEGSEHGALFNPKGTTTGNCPHECGPCGDHEGEVCTAVFHLLDECSLNCPVCFAASASAKRQRHVSLEAVREMYAACLHQRVRPSIQLSGGEVTLRDDLPDIIELGKKMGFRHIQVNTNGLRVASEPEYICTLRDAGLDLIYLQFDGVTDDVYRALRGRELLQAKIEALSSCRKAGMGVLLVPTVCPGVNDHQLGQIVSLAKEWMPTVKGVHFQPVSYFGRFPDPHPPARERLTLPDLVRLLEMQTGGEIAGKAIIPRRKFDAHCSFSSVFMLGQNGRLRPITSRGETPVKKRNDTPSDPFAVESIEFTNKFWRSGPNPECACGDTPLAVSNWLLNYTLSITAMHFQDVWNVDLQRLRGCCVHVATPEGQLIPFCAYYLTGAYGDRIYGGRG